MRRLSVLLLAAVTWLGAGNVWSQDSEMVLQQLKFTAVELLIYTDQLHKFDGTHCSNNIVSGYDVNQVKRELLQKLKPAHRAAFEQLFESEQITRLLSENSAGIESMLGSQRVLAGASLSAQQQAACRELGAVFQENYLQTQQDLQQLVEQY